MTRSEGRVQGGSHQPFRKRSPWSHSSFVGGYLPKTRPAKQSKIQAQPSQAKQSQAKPRQGPKPSQRRISYHRFTHPPHVYVYLFIDSGGARQISGRVQGASRQPFRKRSPWNHSSFVWGGIFQRQALQSKARSKPSQVKQRRAKRSQDRDLSQVKDIQK